MSYAKKNLRDVQDMAVQHGLSDAQEARFPRADLGAEQTGTSYLIVKPGQREALPTDTAQLRRSTLSWQAQGA